MEEIESMTKAYLIQKRKSSSKKGEDAVLKSIQEKQKDALALSEEKVEIASQVYEMVDKHIRALDDDLKKFEDHVRNDGSRGSKRSGSLVGSNAAPVKKARMPAALPVDMPIDPNEPTYCICNRVSFGEMVACENSNCPREWFHYECVGLTEEPDGEWFCTECRMEMRRKQFKMK